MSPPARNPAREWYRRSWAATTPWCPLKGFNADGTPFALLHQVLHSPCCRSCSVTKKWQNEPVWDTADREYPGDLPSSARVDVCVVGAGIAGLSTAYHLTRQGARVIVLDDGPIGGGQTSATTA